MSNKKALRICQTCCSLASGAQTDRVLTPTSPRILSKSSTSNLGQALQSILQNNRSKRKLDLTQPVREIESEQNRPTAKRKSKSPKKSQQKSTLQQTLRILKIKAVEGKCRMPRHENSRLMFICLDPKCEENRLGCAYCFVEEHQNHRKMKVEDFIKGFTEGYLDYLNNFQQVLKSIGCIKKRCQQSLNAQLTHLRHSLNLYVDKLGKKLTSELHHRINSKLTQHHQTLEKSVECINSLHQLEESQQSSCFELKLNHLIALNHKGINEELMVSLEDLKRLREEDCVSMFKDQFVKMNTGLAQLFFNGGTQSDNPVHDSLGFVEEISISSKIRSLKYMSGSRGQSPTSPKSARFFVPASPSIAPPLVQCPFSHKYFINPKLPPTKIPQLLQPFSASEYVNTCTVFKCCSNRYCCTSCHNFNQNHQTQESTPSERICMKCQSIFEVPYPTSVAINCKACVRR